MLYFHWLLDYILPRYNRYKRCIFRIGYCVAHFFDKWHLTAELQGIRGDVLDSSIVKAARPGLSLSLSLSLSSPQRPSPSIYLSPLSLSPLLTSPLHLSIQF